MVHDRHTANPPSTAIAWPVTKRVAGEHGRVTVSAMPRGSPGMKGGMIAVRYL